jgi:hypothetical protein
VLLPETVPIPNAIALDTPLVKTAQEISQSPAVKVILRLSPQVDDGGKLTSDAVLAPTHSPTYPAIAFEPFVTPITPPAALA